VERQGQAAHPATAAEPRVACLVEEVAVEPLKTGVEAAATFRARAAADAAEVALLPGAVEVVEAVAAELRPLRLEVAATGLAHASCSLPEAAAEGNSVPSLEAAAAARMAATAPASEAVSHRAVRPARRTLRAARTKGEAASHRPTARLYLSHAAWRIASSPR
jgi:hypothetical protein